ncbi:hypothetical protein HQ346_04925 [Rhodococcus sp. BP-252]|nr:MULTISPECIES: hypothetical protein [unclassified Rhodococcus (in: high G+C Gram-positive bacteria)]MBY6439363.1 hypothetical protein [Rhodococcus sp. BP-319]MBY6536547.1 hypothetical protein [Rhodococcus sp. BP-148]MBY6410622.1 hypothetical protein [Rhodococcus sp. BP-320]MBY6415553.1 hypothetical protein [Rhodococcus sp. BP-321]MBY6458408.1 hypothetical protein [Rhodococcus sp. BP-260]
MPTGATAPDRHHNGASTVLAHRRHDHSCPQDSAIHNPIRDLRDTDLHVGANVEGERMKKPKWSPSQLHDLSTHGVVTRAMLREAKVSDSTLTARCAPGGPWQHALPSVYLLHNGYPTPLQRSIAALEYCGPTSMITGRVGLGAHGYGTGATPSEVHVLIPSDLRRASKSFVRVERTGRLPDPTIKGSLRVAPLVRCLVDTTRAVTSDKLCTQLFAEVLQRGEVTIADIDRELRDGPRQYGAISRRVVNELRDDAHSVAEAEAQKLYARSGLPPMLHNCNVYTESGVFIGCFDNFLDEVGWVWEVDSYAHHLSPPDHAKTMERRTHIQNQGLLLLSTLPSEIRDNPEKVLADLRSHYELARSRPRPRIVVKP